MQCPNRVSIHGDSGNFSSNKEAGEQAFFLACWMEDQSVFYGRCSSWQQSKIGQSTAHQMSELDQGTAFYPILLFSVAQTRFF